MSPFSLNNIAGDLGPLLAQVGVHKTATFQQVWKRQLDDASQVALFTEITIILVAGADRLAFDKYGDPTRSGIMNRTVDVVRDRFANQRHFGTTHQERVANFQQFLAHRFQKFATCSSMGAGPNSVIFPGARYLTEIFLESVPESQLVEVVLEAGRALSKSVIALLTTPVFKALTEN